MTTETQKQRQSSFPSALLVPCTPWDLAESEYNKSPGKTPCRWVPPGSWGPLYGWQKSGSVTKQQIVDAYEHKANIGLVLGVAVEGWSYLFLDFDTEAGSKPDRPEWTTAHQIRDTAIKQLQAALNVPALWVRNTRPGRAGVLVRLRDGVDPGSKSWLKMYGENDVSLGKIELLAGGQQAVIGGIHRYNNGTKITWYRTDNPDQLISFPFVDDGVPVLSSRAELDAAIESISSSLWENHQVRCSAKATRAEGLSDTVLTPMNTTPPSVEILVKLIDLLPNDQRDYDYYILVSRAVSGCRAALRSKDVLSLEEDQQIEDAIVRWTCRWTEATVFENDARFKWQSDFVKMPTTDIPCWQVLVDQAIHHGNSALHFESLRLRADEIADEFADEAQNEPPSNVPVVQRPEAVQTIPYSELEGLPRPRKIGLLDLAESEMIQADYIEPSLRPIALYLDDTDQWVTWSGTRRGWSTEIAEHQVRRWIEDLLAEYISRPMGDAKDVAKNKATSGARVQSMMGWLRTRLASVSRNINLGFGFIQTPEGAFDIASRRKLTLQQQIDLLDTRVTGCKAIPGPTPKFNDHLRLLTCDDPATLKWLWAYLGYMITGKPNQHIMLVLHGGGKNGKGTLDRILQSILGDYAAVIDRNVLLESGRQKHETGIADIIGKRYWSVSELQPKDKWNEAQLRALTGGDVIKARRMHENFVNIHYEGSFLVTSNDLPKFHRIDEAIARRFRLINTRYKVEEGKAIIDLDKIIIAEEGPAILSRLIDEAALVMADPSILQDVPIAMQTAVNRYFGEQDRFFTWFKRECSPARGIACDLADLRASYDAYVAEMNSEADEPDVLAGIDTMSATVFGDSLRRHGVSLNDENGRRLTDHRDGKTILVAQDVKLRSYP